MKSLASFTHPVQGGTVAPLFRLAVQYERYGDGQSCSVTDSAVEEVTELH